MKKSIFIAGIFSCIVISGCSLNGEHVYTPDGKCISCWNNPITDKPINYDENELLKGDEGTSSETGIKTPSKPSEEEYCGTKVEYNIDVPIDVDLAYVRYKRAFKFKTKNETIRARGLDPDTANPIFTMMNHGFRHVKEPGLRFHMKDTIFLNTIQTDGWLSLELEKSNEQHTRVYVNYCLGGIEGFTEEESDLISKKLKTDYL